MVESSAGKKLNAARRAMGLSIDEAAHAVKMRPDKILALENDDFTRFGSPTYAKGFLLIYSRYLGIDVSENLREFDGLDNRVVVDDYQYLSNVPEPEEEPYVPSRRFESAPRQAPSVVPLLVFILLFGAGGFLYYVYVNAERLDRGKPRSNRSETTVVAPSATPTANPTPEPPRSSPSPIRVASSDARIATNAATVAPTPSANALRAAGLLADEPVAIVNEIIVEPVRKTWVKICKDSPDSPPVFEDYIYPGVRPLKLKGTKFFVEVRDQSSVQIRKNGRPIAYQAPGISIQ